VPLWLQGLLAFGFWMAFWPFLLWWAVREQRSSRTLRVESLYPPRVHAQNAAGERSPRRSAGLRAQLQRLRTRRALRRSLSLSAPGRRAPRRVRDRRRSPGA